MALTLGTNVGFVTTRPTTDPAGTNVTIDGSSVVVRDTSPAGAVKITEIGWYRGSGNNTANFEVALYSESAGVAATRLYVDNTNSSATADGWITTAVDWSISPSTAYWLAVQMDAHTGSSNIDSASSGGSGSDILTSQTTLNDPYGGGAVADSDGMYAIYALTQIAPTVSLSSPADASTTSDTTPDLTFTGTDVNGDDVRYRVQLDTSPLSDISLVQKKANYGTTVTFDSTVTSGNAIVVGIVDWSTTIGTNVLSDGTNTYTRVSVNNSGTNAANIAIYVAENVTGGSLTVTYNNSGSSATLFAVEYSGIALSSSFDQQNTNSNTGTSISSGSVTTTTNGELYFAVTGNDNPTDGAITYTQGGGFTKQLENLNGSSAQVACLEDLVAVAGTYTAQWTINSSQVNYSAIATFKPKAVLVDKISGTDAGFSGSPDNSDPFASGQAVTYTVQSALSNSTTYYWRVRGIDPSGSNTYGSWSSTRSFTVNTSTTTTKTITGKGRLTASTTKTIQGKSRTTATTTKTVSGKGRITTVVAKTISGMGRVTSPSNKTVQGLGRVTAVNTNTTTGKSRITSLSTKTIQGLSRTTTSTNKTTLGKSRVTSSVDKNTLGLSRITAVGTKNIQGVANISPNYSTSSQDIEGQSRVEITSVKTAQGKSRVTSSNTIVVSGKARIQKATLKTVQGIANILVISAKTIPAKSRITAQTSQQILGKGKILLPSTEKTITGKTRITAQGGRTIKGKASILSNIPPPLPKLIYVDGNPAWRIFGKYYILL